jgi:hypothetical protein
MRVHLHPPFAVDRAVASVHEMIEVDPERIGREMIGEW